ncbi:hypothetical protein [Catenulispora rubra]|uniref:hypothetical protein n=1 Tax=Catenulispora rubra TaxID=280293 RepID=UPI001891FC28|nr:hypothetical protein [Catenulispora rubra]
MTDDLTTALRAMAESGQPPAMDVEHVLHQGRHSLIRRRMAAISGGTAAVAATALAVGVLAPAGSAGHLGGVADPASSSTTTPAAAVTTLPPDLDPHDPVTVGWKFGYLPSGMSAYGGGAGGMGKNEGTVSAYDDSGFALSLQSEREDTVVPGNKNNGVPTEKVPASVPGAREAYWAGYGNGQLVNSAGPAKPFAGLSWQLPSGEWMTLVALNVPARADWKEQTLKAAAHIIRQDHSQPLPFRLANLPAGLTITGGSVDRIGGNTNGDLLIQAGPNPSNAPMVMIEAFKIGSMKIGGAVPPQNKNTCADSNGLTMCVSSPDPEPAPLKAAGGAQALLNKVVSLGNDPANWTTGVLS